MWEYKTVSGMATLNLRASIESGQPLTFYSDCKLDNGMERLDYVTQNGAIRVQRERIRPGTLQYSFIGNYTWSTARNEVTSRFGLSHDMKRIYSEINTDPFMNRAINSLYGMRITGNAPWEATLCFLVSQFNNIKRIRGIIRSMISMFGEEIDTDYGAVRLFPTSESISEASVQDLMACGAGFRARYIKSTARKFADNKEYQVMHSVKYDELKQNLMGLDGVGDKVADCILLFGYGKHMAFPIEVWIKRVVENVYFGGRKKSIAQLHEFADEKWGEYGGYAQQYIFENGRRNRVGVS